MTPLPLGFHLVGGGGKLNTTAFPPKGERKRRERERERERKERENESERER